MNEDKASRYHRLKRRASVGGAVLGGLLLAWLAVSGASVWLRDLAVSAGGGPVLVTTIAYCALLAILVELVQLPLAFYSQVTLEHYYGLSTQSTGTWWLDHAKGAGVTFGFGAVAAVFVIALLRWNPEYWWVAASVVFSLLLVGLARVAPVVLLPLFYAVKPLDRQALAARLAGLAERAGTRVIGVFEWQLSDRTRKANAALTGLGQTRRVLLSDTLLAEHSDDEIEVIVAHELAHHVHRDIWTGLALEAALLTVVCYAGDRALSASIAPLGLAGKADVAGLPVLLLVAGAVSIAALPLVNALSRFHERRADRYALTLTRNVGAFVAAMRRLGEQNLAEEQPSPLVTALFYSHPPTAERIAAARAWRARPP